jgi:hypothetical protein
MPPTSSADNPAAELPIHIEGLALTRQHTYRAEAADALERVPIDPDLGWGQLSLIPLIPPALTVNAGPVGVVELVAMVLRPVAGSKLKWEFAGWPGGGAGPPNPSGSTKPLSRVIPANFGNKAPGAYRPTLTGAPAYDGHSWIVDGLNHYVEFPYGTPAGLTAPVLTFYRYTGTTGGTGQVSSELCLNHSVGTPEVQYIYTRGYTDARFIGPGSYAPADRRIPIEMFNTPLTTFSFEASGILRSRVLGSVPPLEATATNISFGVQLGNDFTLSDLVLGVMPVSLGGALYDQDVNWTYKLTATRVMVNFIPQQYIVFVWSAEATVCLGYAPGTRTEKLYVGAFINPGTAIRQQLQQQPGGIQHTIWMGSPDLPDAKDDNRVLEVRKFNHVFKRIA